MRSLIVLAALSTCLAGGCRQHSADGITWVKQGLEHQGVAISLGYRWGEDAGAIEPVAMLERDGAPVADAMVFTSFERGVNQGVSEELATVYEVSADGNAAYYALAEFQPPTGAAECAVHFRIVFPAGQPPWTGEVIVPVRK